MASYSSNTNVNIEFSDEEKETLKRASEILKQLGNDLWHDDSDELSFFFSDLGGGIENALKGNYWIP